MRVELNAIFSGFWTQCKSFLNCSRAVCSEDGLQVNGERSPPGENGWSPEAQRGGRGASPAADSEAELQRIADLVTGVSLNGSHISTGQ